MIVERRKPNCYLCGVRGHMRTQCPKYKPPKIEKGNYETNSESNMECSREANEVEIKGTSEKGEGSVNPKRMKKS